MGRPSSMSVQASFLSAPLERKGQTGPQNSDLFGSPRTKNCDPVINRLWQTPISTLGEKIATQKLITIYL